MENKIGIYYAYWEQNWDADFLPYVQRVADLGFDVLEINAGTVNEMSREQRQRLRAAAADRGLELTMCIGLTADRDPASPDTSVRRNGVEFLKSTAGNMVQLGVKQLSGIIYGAWPGTLPDGEHKQDYVQRSLDSMTDAIRTAENEGVFFNVEVVNRFEQFIMNTSAEAVSYVERVGSPNLKILLDSFHLNIEEDSIGDAIRYASYHLGHLHVGENNRRPPGYGHMPWQEMAKALQDIAFEGHIVMEPFLVPGGEVGRDIRVFRDLRGDMDLDSQAAEALRFMHSLLER